MADRASRVVGTITAGPTPDEHGNVTFNVRIGDEVAIGVANPCGVGWQGEISPENLGLVNVTMATVQAFVEAHEHEMRLLYREAARLRRSKRNLPPVGNTRRGRFELDGQPPRAGDSVRFTARSASTRVEILVFEQGGFVDHCDDWQAVSEADRDEAITIVLDNIFAHPDQAAGLGLDVGLLEELWR